MMAASKHLGRTEATPIASDRKGVLPLAGIAGQLPPYPVVHAYRFSVLGATLAMLGFVAPTVSQAEVTLASPFTDHAVLQRDIPVPIWGYGAAGEKITVRF